MELYCLDTNVLIEGWNRYYSIRIAPNYWTTLDRLAMKKRVFCTMEVKREIKRKDDTLYEWVKNRPHLFWEVDREVQKNLRCIMKEYPAIVSQCRNRNAADPWVIAHALTLGAIVVTKEEPASMRITKIKIPHVCDKLGVPWMNDFQFVEELKIRLT
ncbi:DUF4411 family protein [candidate division TA06 bacterium]|uniref:DUF4411 family protein n=1 Tax=candidate division TA06 bacterium TaxID=2250710 RepID=A0A523USJ5_UNCT6|nr:MAG: DUF4411 family protein [candidate division TA06 bacterium]